MTQQAENLLALGRIGGPYGLRGWVKLLSFTDPAENILSYRHFYLERAKGSEVSQRDELASGEGSENFDKIEENEEIEIDASRAQGKGFVGHIRGCDEREQAQGYAGRRLLVEKAALPDLPGMAYYWHQLEGLEVLTLQDENLGRVSRLLETGANDVLVVRGGDGSIDCRERLIPYLLGQVVKHVDLDRRLIRVAWEVDF